MDMEAIRQAKVAIKISVREALGSSFHALCQAAEGSELFGENFHARVLEALELVNNLERDSHAL